MRLGEQVDDLNKKERNKSLLFICFVVCFVAAGAFFVCFVAAGAFFICFVAAGASFVCFVAAGALFVLLPQVLSLFSCRRCFLYAGSSPPNCCGPNDPSCTDVSSNGSARTDVGSTHS